MLLIEIRTDLKGYSRIEVNIDFVYLVSYYFPYNISLAAVNDSLYLIQGSQLPIILIISLF